MQEIWPSVIARVESFAIAARTIRGVVINALLISGAIWLAGFYVHREVGRMPLLILGIMTLAPLVVIGYCSWLLSMAERLPNVLRENAQAFSSLLEHNIPDVGAAIKAERWKGLFRTIRSGVAIFRTVRSLSETGREVPALIGSAMAVASPAFWIVLAIALLATAAQNVIIGLAVLIRVAL